MKKYTLFLVCCMISLIAAAAVSAQGFTGPGANSPPPPPPGPGHNLPPPPPHGGPDSNPPPPPFEGITDRQGLTGLVWNVRVEQAKNYPHDSWIVITGNIISVLPGGRHFMFRDSSSEIPIEIGPKEWRGLSVGVSDKVEISGEVKRERGQVFIKVHAIRKI
jgi:uncharacterized protein (TIGR00156 family)